jgi:uncharacterized protein
MDSENPEIPEQDREEAPPEVESAPEGDSAEAESREEEERSVPETGSLSLSVSLDRMKVVLDCPVPPDDADSLILDITEELRVMGIGGRWLDEAYDARLRDLIENCDYPIEGEMLIEGQRPSEPAHGYVEWAKDFFSNTFVIDPETGAIDYRKRANQVSVSQGQLLATIHPPKAGEPGLNVYGNRIDPNTGRWPPLKAGNNVNWDHESHTLKAARTGRIRMRLDTVMVDEVFVVEGNVDLETGDIDHPGTVIVKGDIEAGAEVRAKGDIEVYGVIEQAAVTAGGSLTVRGGINGRGKGPVRAKGAVHAMFINEAVVEADSDILVHTEILNSRVKTTGSIVMAHGRLVGGKAMARNAIILGQLGSEALAPTEAQAGVDFHIIDGMETRHQEIEAASESLKQVKKEINHIYNRHSTITETLQEQINQLRKRERSLTSEIDKKHSQATTLHRKALGITRIRIEVLQMIYPETRISTYLDRMKVKEAFPGPCYVLREHDELKIMGGQPR